MSGVDGSFDRPLPQAVMPLVGGIEGRVSNAARFGELLAITFRVGKSDL
jgi:hypothetical protein